MFEVSCSSLLDLSLNSHGSQPYVNRGTLAIHLSSSLAKTTDCVVFKLLIVIGKGGGDFIPMYWCLVAVNFSIWLDI